MGTLKNHELKPATEALAVIGRTALPTPLAMRMVRARRTLQESLEAFTEASNNLILRHADGKTSIGPEHENWRAFCRENDELMMQEVEVPDTFALYQRDNGEGPEWAWDKSFKETIGRAEPNALYGLGPMLEIVEVE